jgi:hypothetical protein
MGTRLALVNETPPTIAADERISRNDSISLVIRVGKAHVRTAIVNLCDLLLPFIRLQSISQSDFAELPHSVGST